jgi:hypothetical protein
MVCSSRESGDLHTLAATFLMWGIIISRKEEVKKENLKRETHGLVARCDWRKGLCAYRAPDACMITLVGFMVSGWCLVC